MIRFAADPGPGTVPAPRAAPRDQSRAKERRTLPAEFPLLAWVAGELERDAGLDGRNALRAARKVLEEAFASLDRTARHANGKETSQ